MIINKSIILKTNRKLHSHPPILSAEQSETGGESECHVEFTIPESYAASCDLQASQMFCMRLHESRVRKDIPQPPPQVRVRMPPIEPPPPFTPPFQTQVAVMHPDSLPGDAQHDQAAALAHPRGGRELVRMVLPAVGLRKSERVLLVQPALRGAPAVVRGRHLGGVVRVHAGTGQVQLDERQQY